MRARQSAGPFLLACHVPIQAITLDLDDTLWPIAPAIVRAEQRLHAWLHEHAPAVAQTHPPSAMRALRDAVQAEHPELGHDLTQLRKLSLRRAFAPHGLGEAAVESAFEVFFAARHEVEFYPDVLPALQRLARRFRLVALSNGNAEVRRLGLGHLFEFSLNAREHGRAKPDPSIFLAACTRLALRPDQVLHVGDHPVQDVAGARGAGLHAVWLARDQGAWPLPGERPQRVSCLHSLADNLAA